jgi:phenylpropionate dioxygenase-like ring-hydroxylating dioxygenase large terminal subunit
VIRNQWYAVLDSQEVKTGKPVGVTRLGEKLVFWRNTQGKVNCLRDACPHRGAALSVGKVAGDRLECPFHGFQYDQSGQCQLLPANGKNAPLPKQMKAVGYPTYEAHGFIFIWWGEASAVTGTPQFFDDLEGMTYATVRDPWRAHYSRVIENQLDVAHLPFVHYNTIGSGGRTLVDGPLVEWDGPDHFRIFVFNRLDDGSLPRKPQELSHPDVEFWVEFIFPNMWQNHLGANARIVVAFTPVDEEHTIMYLRFYQRFARLPVLRSLVAYLAMPLNVYIAHQDRRVVETQEPKRSELKIGEKLVQADRPVVLYRTRRQELIERGLGLDGAPPEKT